MEMYNNIKLLIDAFTAHGLKHQVTENEQYQEIHVPFGIKNGPLADVKFISAGRGNDTQVRIMNLVNAVPEEKRYKVLEACNTLNNKYRYIKFNMDKDNDVHVEYDLPVSTGNDCLGEMAVEIFIRTVQILNEGYILIAKALYTADEPASDSKTDPDREKDLLKLLKDNHDGINIRISKTTSPDAEDQEN